MIIISIKQLGKLVAFAKKDYNISIYSCFKYIVLGANKYREVE